MCFSVFDNVINSYIPGLQGHRESDHGAVSMRKTVLPGMAIPMLKIRRPNGRLIFNMDEAHIPGLQNHKGVDAYALLRFTCFPSQYTCTKCYLKISIIHSGWYTNSICHRSLTNSRSMIIHLKSTKWTDNIYISRLLWMNKVWVITNFSKMTWDCVVCAVCVSSRSIQWCVIQKNDHSFDIRNTIIIVSCLVCFYFHVPRLPEFYHLDRRTERLKLNSFVSLTSLTVNTRPTVRTILSWTRASYVGTNTPALAWATTCHPEITIRTICNITTTTAPITIMMMITIAKKTMTITNILKSALFL